MTEQTASQPTKTIDSDRVVRHLNRNFADAISGLGKAAKDKNGNPNKLYQLQVEFAYMIDEIQRGPVYLMPKVIADANELITKIKLEKAEAQEAKAKK